MAKLGRTRKSDLMRRYLLDGIRDGRENLIQDAVEVFGLSRQTIHKHLAALVANGYLVAEGKTKARTYRLGPIRQRESTYKLAEIDEHRVHRSDFAYLFDGLPQNVSEICHYGFTEMVNNAIDHSEGEEVTIIVERDNKQVMISVDDDGEGIFRRIARILKLPDPRESLLELSKGKLTTDPENHTGEGIFFTSRVFDTFLIRSGDLDFTHADHLDNDYLYQLDEHKAGTMVVMIIALDSQKDLGKVFDEYSSGPDEFRFERTVVPVRLALYEGERLVSRSQAKRLLNRVERFKYVVLDFTAVDFIGQAFADEVFRVFQRRHPEISLTPVNMSGQVKKMVNRALFHTDPQ
jgi:anti-sigma regulatory factor (Ser/Thr protein kinase)